MYLQGAGLGIEGQPFLQGVLQCKRPQGQFVHHVAAGLLLAALPKRLCQAVQPHAYLPQDNEFRPHIEVLTRSGVFHCRLET